MSFTLQVFYNKTSYDVRCQVLRNFERTGSYSQLVAWWQEKPCFWFLKIRNWLMLPILQWFHCIPCIQCSREGPLQRPLIALLLVAVLFDERIDWNSTALLLLWKAFDTSQGIKTRLSLWKAAEDFGRRVRTKHSNFHWWRRRASLCCLLSSKVWKIDVTANI